MTTSATMSPMQHAAGAAPSSWTSPGPVGARVTDKGCTFRVWAPAAERVELHLVSTDTRVPMHREARGYFATEVENIAPGTRYKFVLDGETELPDPASRFQPEGVHGASEVVSHTFEWTDDDWHPPALKDFVMYELHVGTFTPDGTFDGVVSQLDRLRDVGINAIEILPVSQFPGTRNWGYDGVYPFAVQDSYGGPAGLKRLIDAAHAKGIAVTLDVVYNHMGPEGNYLSQFGPYFTDMYRTPWGAALNFDGASSDEVRAFFIQSAVQWVEEYHFDALRFDAVHAIVDASARPFLAELTDTLRETMRKTGRAAHLIAESDLSDPRVIRPSQQGGLGFDAQWLDDFHHAVHALVTEETQGYYADYGAMDHLERALTQAYVYAGDYSAHRGRRHGAPLDDVRPEQFVVFVQNHDQVGNRLAGDRLSTMIPFEGLKLIAAATLLAPYVPMLFMGEEYGEKAPFPFFVSHGDEQLVEAVRKGRKEEFASFGWSEEPPDPQGEETFRSAILDPAQGDAGEGRALLTLHRDLIALRRRTPLLHTYGALSVDVRGHDKVLLLTRRAAGRDLLLVLNFGADARAVDLRGDWQVRMDTSHPRYSAGGTQGPQGRDEVVHDTLHAGAWSAVLLERESV
jgi:maltooligosyltrehalose trehalohydrolase